MTTHQRILKAEDIVRTLDEQVGRAIALRAMWARADRGDVLSAMRSDDLAPGFEVVRDALHIDLILTLMRLHESAGQEPASIPHVVDILRDAAIRHALDSVGRGGDATYDALRLFDALPHDVLKRLRQHRDRVLAHNDRRGGRRGERLVLEVEPSLDNQSGGDESVLLDQSIAIVAAMNRAICGQGPTGADRQREWDARADAWWKRVGRR